MFDNLKLAIYKLLPLRAQIFTARWGTPNFTVGTVALITRDGTSVLLVRPSYRRDWAPPGGFVARGETPMQALGREIEEELGVRMNFEPEHRVSFDAHRQGITFVSVGLAPPEAEFRKASREIREIRWFPLDALPPMPMEFRHGVPEVDLEAIRVIASTRR